MNEMRLRLANLLGGHRTDKLSQITCDFLLIFTILAEMNEMENADYIRFFPIIIINI